MNYWLFKSEPNTYSIDDLIKEKNQITAWTGIRNYQARNFMRDQIKKGDLAFFYHSSCKIIGIVGIMEVIKEAYTETPPWCAIDVQFKRKFKKIIELSALKKEALLKNMILLRRGNRLSITPVSKKEWEFILKLADRE